MNHIHAPGRNPCTFRKRSHRSSPGFLPTSAGSTSFKTGWAGLDLELEVPLPAFHPSLFVTVKLHDHVSNTIGFDLDEMMPIHFKGGEPVDLECADLSVEE